MKNKPSMPSKLIAPCGMNCRLCVAYMRAKNTCPGCRNIDISESKYCRECIIRNCPTLREKKMKFCSSQCDQYPCKRLKNLDKRYRTKYGMSMIENLENISKLGVRQFIKNEKTRWTCKTCAHLLCVHKDLCQNCGAKKTQQGG